MKFIEISYSLVKLIGFKSQPKPEIVEKQKKKHNTTETHSITNFKSNVPKNIGNINQFPN